MNDNFLKQRFIKSWIILANAATDGYFCVQILKKQSKYSVASLYNILLQIFCKLKILYYYTICSNNILINNYCGRLCQHTYHHNKDG